jgi:hypothetical protein
MTEGKTEIPDEAPLSEGELIRATTGSLTDLLAFINGQDGFIGDGVFDFFAYGCRFLGHYKLVGHMGKEELDMTRCGDGVYDHASVRVNPRNGKLPNLMTYSDLTNGSTTPPNSHGALRGIRGMTRPPAPQGPEA